MSGESFDYSGPHRLSSSTKCRVMTSRTAWRSSLASMKSCQLHYGFFPYLYQYTGSLIDVSRVIYTADSLPPFYVSFFFSSTLRWHSISSAAIDENLSIRNVPSTTDPSTPAKEITAEILDLYILMVIILDLIRLIKKILQHTGELIG